MIPTTLLAHGLIALGNNTQGKFKAKYKLYVNATLFSVFHVNKLIVRTTTVVCINYVNSSLSSGYNIDTLIKGAFLTEILE